MIRQMAWRNFKSWRDTGCMRLAPITALFGTNSSGKTSLLQMLLMLKQTAESSDRSQALYYGDERSLVELGTFKELLFEHDLSRPLEFDLEWKLKEKLTVENPAAKPPRSSESDSLGFSARIKSRFNGDHASERVVVSELEYRFSDHSFGMRLAESGNNYELFSKPEDFVFLRGKGRPTGLPAPAKCYGFPDQVRVSYQNASFLSDFELEFEKLFSRVSYLGPLRDYPKRQYSWAGAEPTDMGRRGERVVDAILASRERGVKLSRGRGRGKTRQTLDERVAQWLRELGLIESFSVRPIVKGGKLFQVWVRRNSKASEVLLTDVGFGVSQILPVIVLCYYASEGSTVILEQPEIHLHPSVQAGLADVIIDAVKTRKIQVIVESHSEHLLRRLQRRIAEEQLSADEAALYFCAMEGGESKLTELELDLFGHIANWPKDFFGDEFGEIAAMSKAAIQRKRRTA